MPITLTVYNWQMTGELTACIAKMSIFNCIYTLSSGYKSDYLQMTTQLIIYIVKWLYNWLLLLLLLLLNSWYIYKAAAAEFLTMYCSCCCCCCCRILYTRDYIHSQMTIQLTIYMVKWQYNSLIYIVKCLYNWLYYIATWLYKNAYIDSQMTIQLTIYIIKWLNNGL